MMKIEIDPASGFCFGVERVIQNAEAMLRAGESLYGLGEMVHNRAEVERLQSLGLQTIQHSDLPSMRSRKVLFRAHGEPPATYQLAREHGVEVIDGTCPIVIRLQERIRIVYGQLDRMKEQLVIFGKQDHPETIGLLGQVNGDAVVVSGLEDIGKIEPGKKVYLFSQTTMDPDLYTEMENAIQSMFLSAGSDESTAHFQSECSICGQMKKRKPHLAGFAQRFDLVLFVSGKNSSNGKMLFEFCRGINPSTRWISVPGDVEPEWFPGIRTVGISGATSTSHQQLEKIREQVLRLVKS
jgi:4-hydroxy-3-methylbut-2-enyl diphosphate reductase